MCKHLCLIYRIVRDNNVRLFDRYGCPLGLDHQLAKRVAICVYTVYARHAPS
jgi:hypothetical protein